MPMPTPLTPWQAVNGVMRDADALERAARLRMERGGITYDDALAWAVAIREGRTLPAATTEPERSLQRPIDSPPP